MIDFNKLKKIDEGVYVGKDIFGYKLVYPYKNEDGSFNWFNMILGGSWWNVLLTIFIITIVLFGVWAYKHDVEAYKSFADKIISDPMGFCNKLMTSEIKPYDIQSDKYNLSEILKNLSAQISNSGLDT